jgi:hypothetical protein
MPTKYQHWKEIKAYHREGEPKVSLDDFLCDKELELIRRERDKLNGNGSQPQRVICWCAEGIISGKRVPVHRPEDCRYTAARSALIPEAVARADAVFRNNPASGQSWTRRFVQELDRLAAPLLRQPRANDH